MIDGFLALYIFMLAAFTGKEIIARVPVILHTPLMSGSNFVHGIVLVGAMVALAEADSPLAKAIGFIGVVLGAGNAAGGYVVTERMLELEMRLRERVESERVLDAEVRSLQRDAALRLAYLSDLESQHQALLVAHEDLLRGVVERDVLQSSLAATQTRADAEAHHRQALQSRAVVRLADSAARSAAGHPLAMRAGMWAARKVARRLS